MQKSTAIAFSIALAPTMACRMLYITADQDGSEASSISSETTKSNHVTMPIDGPDASSSSSSSSTTTTTTGSPTSASSNTTSVGVTLDTTTSPTSSSSSTSASASSSTSDSDTSSDASESDTAGSKCGNGGLDPDEECDDGNENNGPSEFCSQDCKRLGRLAFITDSGAFTGQLAENDGQNPLIGVLAAHAACNAAAMNIPEVGPGHEFLAWISAWDDNDTPIASPKKDFKKCSRPYYSPINPITNKRDLIAPDYENLTNGGLKILNAPLRISEKGNVILGNLALTGTKVNGDPEKEEGETDCSNWTDKSDETMAYGKVGATNYRWTERRAVDPLGACSGEYHLYCFEQCP